MTEELKGGSAGCVCNAYYSGECACDADWTDPEIYALRDTNAVLQTQIDCYINQVNNLFNKVKRLKNALEYYADAAHYTKEMRICGLRQEGVLTDGGDKARKALEEKL